MLIFAFSKPIIAQYCFLISSEWNKNYLEPLFGQLFQKAWVNHQAFIQILGWSFEGNVSGDFMRFLKLL